MLAADKGAKQKHVDVNAVLILQIEAFLPHAGLVVGGQRKRPETPLRLAHVLLAFFAPPPLDQTDIDVEQIEAAPNRLVDDVVDKSWADDKRQVPVE